MSISDNYEVVRSIGNGVTTEFSADWDVLASEYLRVYKESAADGSRVLQVLGVNFTLAFAEDGLIVTYTVAPTASEYSVIGREVAIDQTNPYKTSKGFQGEVVEASFDKLTAILQDQRDMIARSPRFALGSTFAYIEMEDPQDGRVYYYDLATNKFKVGPTITEIADAASLAGSGILGYFTVTSGTNPTNGFNLDTDPDPYGFYTATARSDVAVYVGGRKQCVFRDSLWLSQDYGQSTNWLVLGGGSSLDGAVEGSVVITAESNYADSVTIRITGAGVTGLVHLCQKVKGDTQDPDTPDSPDNSMTHFSAGGALAGTEVVKGYISVLGALNSNDAVISIQRTNASYHPGLLIYTVSQGSITFKSDNTVCTLMKLQRVASAVNYPVVSPSATGNNILLTATGSDSAIGFSLIEKGAGINVLGKANASYINLTGTTVPPLGLYNPSANTIGVTSRSALVIAITNPASPVNYLILSGAATGGAPYVLVAGTDTNIPVIISSKGNSPISFKTNGNATEQVRIDHFGSATDYMTLSGGTGEVILSCEGSNAIINIEYTTKGAGSHVFASGNGDIFSVDDPGGTVENGLAILGGVTGTAPQFYAFGETNVALEFYSKGNESIRFYTDYGDEQLAITHTNNPTTYFALTGGAGIATLSTLGSATNRDIALTPAGTGRVRYGTYVGTPVANTGYFEMKMADGTVKNVMIGA